MMDQLGNALQDERWSFALEIFIVVLAVVTVNFMAHRSLARLIKKAESTESVWDDAFLKSIERPGRLLVWLVGLAFAAQIAQQQTGAALFEAIPSLRDLGVIFCMAWFLFRFIVQAEENILAAAAEDPDSQIDRTTADAIAKLLRASIAITAVLVAMQTLGISIAGVLAFGGIGGFAVGYAAKDLLANFFGGLTIYLDRPFAVGDWIRSPDRNIEGTVEKIGWRSTRIRTFDKRPLYIPNAIFTSIVVENPSRMTSRRIYETIGLRYDDIACLQPILEDVRSMLRGHDAIDQDLIQLIYFDAFSASSLDFFVYCMTRTTDWKAFHGVKEDVLMKIAEIVEAHGAEMAFPTRTVLVAGGDTLAPEVTGA